MKKNISPPHAIKGERIAQEPLGGKVPSLTMRPYFSFHLIEKKYGINSLQKNNQVNLIKHLYSLSQLEWKQIESAPRHGLGFEHIKRNEINFSLPPFVTDDTSILAFRYCGKLAMVGYRYENVFHILGIDQNFNKSCYDHS